MYTALSGQLAAFKHLELIANNLANMTTSGFRAERLVFENALNKEHSRFSGTALKSDIVQPSNLASNQFVGIKGSYTDFGQGAIENTNNPLHVAIQGEGFFVVQTPQGERFTRAGNFRLDTQHRLVTQEGYPVQGSSGDMTIDPSAEIQITGEGVVMANKERAGKFRIAKVDPSGLEREAKQLFKVKDGAPVSEVENVMVRSGAIEASNVNPMRELTDMILASRVYDSFNKVVESNSRMNELRNQRVGSTQG